MFFSIFSLACDNLTSCDVILSVGWSKLKEVVVCLNSLSILAKFSKLPLFFHLSLLLPLNSLIRLVFLGFEKVILFYSFLPPLLPPFLHPLLCLFNNPSHLQSQMSWPHSLLPCVFGYHWLYLIFLQPISSSLWINLV